MDGDDDGQERTESDRGTNTLVFIPSSEVNTHIINLPKDKMDFWIPGWVHPDHPDQIDPDIC